MHTEGAWGAHTRVHDMHTRGCMRCTQRIYIRRIYKLTIFREEEKHPPLFYSFLRDGKIWLIEGMW